MNLLQKYEDESLTEGITESLMDKNGYWIPVTYRSRILVYSNERVNESELSTYEDLANDKWKGRLLVRSSSNSYNQARQAAAANKAAEAQAELVRIENKRLEQEYAEKLRLQELEKKRIEEERRIQEEKNPNSILNKLDIKILCSLSIYYLPTSDSYVMKTLKLFSRISLLISFNIIFF